MDKVLETTQSVGKTFQLPGEVCGILVLTHQGGEWVVEVEHPDTLGTWQALASPTFDEADLKPIRGFAELNYRLNGGAQGAEAWALSGRLLNPGAIGDK